MVQFGSPRCSEMRSAGRSLLLQNILARKHTSRRLRSEEIPSHSLVDKGRT